MAGGVFPHLMVRASRRELGWEKSRLLNSVPGCQQRSWASRYSVSWSCQERTWPSRPFFCCCSPFLLGLCGQTSFPASSSHPCCFAAMPHGAHATARGESGGRSDDTQGFTDYSGACTGSPDSFKEKLPFPLYTSQRMGGIHSPNAGLIFYLGKGFY